MVKGKGDDCSDYDDTDDNTCDHTSNSTAGKGVRRAPCSLHSAILEYRQTALVVVLFVEIDAANDWEKICVAVSILYIDFSGLQWARER
jgi:hypothetical protein